MPEAMGAYARVMDALARSGKGGVLPARGDVLDAYVQEGVQRRRLSARLEGSRVAGASGDEAERMERRLAELDDRLRVLRVLRELLDDSEEPQDLTGAAAALQVLQARARVRADDAARLGDSARAAGGRP